MSLTQTVPALPVKSVPAAVAFYRERLGFAAPHEEADFAVVQRDGAEIHLWAAADRRWRDRSDLAQRPIRSGAESFLAGTASCRIQTDAVDELYAELSNASVLHPTDTGAPATTDWGTREFATLDLCGNLVTFFQRN